MITIPVIVALVIGVALTLIGSTFGHKKVKESNKKLDSVVTMVETRQALLTAINRELDNAGWWTKRRIRKQLIKKGLVKVCHDE